MKEIYHVQNCQLLVQKGIAYLYEMREEAQAEIDILEIRWALEVSDDEMSVYGIEEVKPVTER